MSSGERLHRRWLAFVALALMLGAPALRAQNPSNVTVAGSLQSELGCPGDWQPDCADTHLAYDAEDDVWQGTFTVPAGGWEYKAPINDSWDENYGLNAAPGGANIPLNLGAETAVKFYYDHKTHWITDNQGWIIATAPGNFQDELGCAADWQPSCLRSWLQDPDGDGIYGFTTDGLPAGSYETKVAINEDWSENYGQGGAPGGANIPFTVPADCALMGFAYDPVSHLLSVSELAAPAQPSAVTIAGSLQSELGCPGDWQPDCAATHLGYDAEDDVWQGTFTVPAGSWEYKAPLNDSWDLNYGLNATQNGANIALNLGAETGVKFYYSDTTHWVTDNQNAVIATAAGSFQDELGCSGDWQPWCLRSWLQDPDGDGIYSFSTNKIPPGNYEVKVALNESWDVNYGADGVQNGPNIAFTVPAACVELFFTYDSTTHVLTVGTEAGGPKGSLFTAKAHWLTADTLAWNLGSGAADFDVRLYHAANGGLALSENGIEGSDGSILLTYDPAGLPASVVAKFPHLAGFQAFKISAGDLALVPQMLKGQVALGAAGSDGTPVDNTSIQIPGVLDDLFYYQGQLGAIYDGTVPTLKLWAPTAKSVSVNLYAGPGDATPAATVPLSEDAGTGVWSITGNASWYGAYYLYDVEVYVPSTGQVEHNLVTDPYSVSLAANSARSQLIDLADPATMPAGWAELEKPYLRGPEDAVVYELHVRDFSATDPTVSSDARGRFLAFTEDTLGMEHLRNLAAAGLTFVHLLPSFDIATVTERREDQQEPDFGVLATYSSDSDQQQAAIAPIRDQDGFNWGYDPVHYTVPDGSYATDPDGPARILEFRQMVQALNQAGLRVVMDVVYNHTNSAGQNPFSVLDRVVPGYYHRLNLDGAIETSSCCSNTASEHLMMEKLLIDSVVTWARDYKVDGFRFDLMGHHMLANMLNLRQAVDALTPETDGVDGSRVFIYGEGWNFGEVANNARGVNATQFNVAGTGLATFNDRIRDSVRGGGPFSGQREQGFATGLYFDPNDTDQGTAGDQLDRLKQLQDRLRVSLAGSLNNYQLEDRFGNVVNSTQIDYNGQPAGYTADPQEVINYVSAHDNETLFDAIQFKVPVTTTPADRARAQVVALSTVALGEGVPFFHAGSDMLRSKSLDRDSYNSGDWFNKLDFTYTTNNWGVGLPPAWSNQSNWPLMQPLLADANLAVGPAEIAYTVEQFQDLLAIRRSSRLFRIDAADDVRSQVHFLGTGPSQLPGLVVMRIDDAGPGRLDPRREMVVVLFNANDEAQTFTATDLIGKKLKLHPIQQTSADPVVQTASFNKTTGTFSVPGRTTAVFQLERSVQVQIELLKDQISALVDSGELSHAEGLLLLLPLHNTQLALKLRLNHVAEVTMDQFIRRVEFYYDHDRLGLDLSQELLEKAEDILSRL